jgi:hypothetical protein
MAHMCSAYPASDIPPGAWCKSERYKTQVYVLFSGILQIKCDRIWIDYELVRIHHPDAPACRHVPPAERHTRFQSLSTAYDTLRGRRTSSPVGSDAYEAELARRRRRSHYTHAHTHAHFHGHGHRDWRAWSFDLPGDNDRHGQGRAWDATDPAHRWKDRVLLITGGLALAVGLSPMIMAPFRVGDERHRSAVKNLSEARADAREYGMEQRRAIRERVAQDRRKSEEEGER